MQYLFQKHRHKGVLSGTAKYLVRGAFEGKIVGAVRRQGKTYFEHKKRLFYMKTAPKRKQGLRI